MSDKQLAVIAGLTALLTICVTVLLALGVPSTAIIGVLSVLVLPTLGAMLYGKVSTIEKNTNGNTSAKDATIDSLIEHLKTHNSVPIEELPEAKKAA